MPPEPACAIDDDTGCCMEAGSRSSGRALGTLSARKLRPQPPPVSPTDEQRPGYREQDFFLAHQRAATAGHVDVGRGVVSGGGGGSRWTRRQRLDTVRHGPGRGLHLHPWSRSMPGPPASKPLQQLRLPAPSVEDGKGSMSQRGNRAVGGSSTGVTERRTRATPGCCPESRSCPDSPQSRVSCCSPFISLFFSFSPLVPAGKPPTTCLLRSGPQILIAAQSCFLPDHDKGITVSYPSSARDFKNKVAMKWLCTTAAQHFIHCASSGLGGSPHPCPRVRNLEGTERRKNSCAIATHHLTSPPVAPAAGLIHSMSTELPDWEATRARAASDCLPAGATVHNCILFACRYWGCFVGRDCVSQAELTCWFSLLQAPDSFDGGPGM